MVVFKWIEEHRCISVVLVWVEIEMMLRRMTDGRTGTRLIPTTFVGNINNMVKSDNEHTTVKKMLKTFNG